VHLLHRCFGENPRPGDMRPTGTSSASACACPPLWDASQRPRRRRLARVEAHGAGRPLVSTRLFASARLDHAGSLPWAAPLRSGIPAHMSSGYLRPRLHRWAAPTPAVCASPGRLEHGHNTLIWARDYCVAPISLSGQAAPEEMNKCGRFPHAQPRASHGLWGLPRGPRRVQSRVESLLRPVTVRGKFAYVAASKVAQNGSCAV
jgi:hypothetical protein